jgi:hypothetical protein
MRKIFFLVLIPIVLDSCSSYNMKSIAYQRSLLEGNSVSASAELDKNKFLKKNRNQLLYYFEKGKVEYLSGNYAASNAMLNGADAFIEDKHASVGNQVIGVITNPENEVYFGEDFEQVAIHYYKAMNYVFLNQPDEALVEVRKINLRLQAINDAYPPDKQNKYTTDAFALTLQGLLYEYAGETNDAFIAYRNAVDLYLINDGNYFGVTCPAQLKQDLLRTAKMMGFMDQFHFYQEQFGEMEAAGDQSTGGELVVFWENGLVPYKDQTYYSFSILPGNEDGVLVIQNEELNIVLPIPVDTGDDHENDFSDIEIFNVAFPKYVERTPHYNTAIATLDSTAYTFELTQDYSTIAFQTLKNRTFREIGKAALRLGAKKVSEYLVRDENDNLGTALGILNALTEHADTRNWQSLPNNIQYTRIPLSAGENDISINFTGANGTITKHLNAVGNGRLQFQKVVTLDTDMPQYLDRDTAFGSANWADY